MVRISLLQDGILFCIAGQLFEFVFLPQVVGSIFTHALAS